MANLREIKNRIESVKNTQKITNAMYLIASTKLQKARAEQEKTKPYFELQESEMKRIFQQRSDIDSHYFYPETGRKPAESYAYLVITADKGLAGAYNHNILKLAESEMARHKRVHLFVVGEYGRQYFMKHQIPIERTFLYTAQNPTFRRARRIAEELLALYNRGECDEIRVIYSRMGHGTEALAQKVQLLPFTRGDFGRYEEKSGGIRKTYEFYPNPTAALENIVSSYVAGCIYGALVESFCSEQNARMNAMKAANDNADELLGNLSVQYNRVRQAAITQEITEVAAGAKAQKKRREDIMRKRREMMQKNFHEQLLSEQRQKK